MINRPTLIISEKICRANIKRMAEKAISSGVSFRPHFKTHQSVQVGEWFREEGVEKITVSSAEMAVHFAAAGWKDITIAFPVNLRETDTYNELALKIKLNLLTDSPEATEALANSLSSALGIFIEVDCGYSRSGVPFPDHERTEHILNVIRNSDKLIFKGFLTHSGNTYQAANKHEVINIHHGTIMALHSLKGKYNNEFPDLLISIGDTPSCSLIENLSGADEIRPGNFVFYDLMQFKQNICEFDDLAVSVACPVCGIYPERKELLIYGGAVHFSKEFLEEDGRYYGLIVRYLDSGWSGPVPDTRLVSISQDHGIIKTSDSFLSTVKHGDVLGIIPVHSCLTTNLLRENMLIV